MISLLEIAERIRSGPKMNEKEWNLALFKKMEQLVQKYGLEYSGPERFFNVDKNYIDNAFQAAVDFLVESGVYCASNNRIIKFSEEEVKQAARSAPSQVIVGEGKDARTIRRRELEDTRPVNVIAGGHCPWREDLLPLPLWVRGIARIPRVDIVEGFNFIAVDGVKADGAAMRAYAAKRAIERMREGVRKAGRDGMAITYYPIDTEASTMIAPIDPDHGLRRTDGALVSILPDIKVEENLLTAAMVFEDYGMYRVNGGAFAMVGGFCGGIAGALIEVIAKTLAAWMIYRDVFQYELTTWSGVITPLKPGESGRPVWSSFAINEAIRRHTNIIRFGGDIYWRVLQTTTDNLFSADHLLCDALHGIIMTVIGKNLLFMPLYDGAPPPNVEFKIEVSDATVRGNIKLNDLDGLIRSIIQEKLKGKLVRGDFYDRRPLIYDNPKAFIEPIQRGFDYIRQKPSQEFIENKNKVMTFLEDLGLNFAV